MAGSGTAHLRHDDPDIVLHDDVGLDVADVAEPDGPTGPTGTIGGAHRPIA